MPAALQYLAASPAASPPRQRSRSGEVARTSLKGAPGPARRQRSRSGETTPYPPAVTGPVLQYVPPSCLGDVTPHAVTGLCTPPAVRQRSRSGEMRAMPMKLPPDMRATIPALKYVPPSAAISGQGSTNKVMLPPGAFRSLQAPVSTSPLDELNKAAGLMVPVENVAREKAMKGAMMQHTCSLQRSVYPSAVDGPKVQRKHEVHEKASAGPKRRFLDATIEASPVIGTRSTMAALEASPIFDTRSSLAASDVVKVSTLQRSASGSTEALSASRSSRGGALTSEELSTSRTSRGAAWNAEDLSAGIVRLHWKAGKFSVVYKQAKNECPEAAPEPVVRYFDGSLEVDEVDLPALRGLLTSDLAVSIGDQPGTGLSGAVVIPGPEFFHAGQNNGPAVLLNAEVVFNPQPRTLCFPVLVRYPGFLHEKKEVHLCPAGHELEQFVSDGKHLCDKCQFKFPEGTTLYGCRQCDFDACCGCVKSFEAKSRKEVDEMKLAELEKQKSELEAELKDHKIKVAKAHAALETAKTSAASKAAAEARVAELEKQNVALEADLASHKTKVGQTQAALAAAKASDAAKSFAEAKLVKLQKQKADLEADLASHRDRVDEAASTAASALKAATASDSAKTLAEAKLAELKRQNAALEADLASHKIKVDEANSALSAAASSDLAKAAAETKVAALEKQKAELETDLTIHQGRISVAAARAASALEAANISNAAKADAEEKLAELERQKAALEEQARSNTRACRSLELAHKRLAEDEGQMFLRLCFKSWALIRCVHGPLKLKEEVPPCLEVEPKASSSCASQPKDADFHAPLAAVHSRARRLEAELVAVTARIALKQEEVQEALNSAEQVRMQERKQGSQVHSDAEKLQASQQKDASIAVEQAHIGRAASVALSEQGAASGAVVCEQHNFLEVFVTYASGFASSSRLSMKLGCGRRKEALMATMQIHPLRFDLRSCFETGTKAYMNGSASLCLRTSSTLGEATVVVHPLHDRYHVCLHAPEMTSELGVGLPTDPGITEEELGTFQTPIMLDLCVRGPSAVPDAAMMSRAATQQHPYLRRHALEQYMAGLLRTMAHEQVADPCAFMREQLQALAHDPPAAPPAPPPPPPPPPPLPLRPLPPPPDQSLGSSAAAPGGLPAGICEVSLHGAEGIPDGAVLCFTGLVQGKAAASQLLQGSVLRLPVQSGKREPLKVTVMQAEHETTLPLDPAQPHYQATLQDSPARQEIGLHVRGVNSKRLLTADAVAIGSPGKRLQVSRPRDSARQYIQSQGLITLTQELLRDVVAEQPANPYRFLLERLDGRRSFCPKGVLRGQSGKRAAAPGTAQMDHEPISLERQLEEMMALVAKVADVED
mmetsp:Transcript_77556/g.141951  ORF Transcript_77556/g.141951 Transcript_77556/m.141951 type:complete len:1353 (-) Transcript_77556:110-4168(-)